MTYYKLKHQVEYDEWDHFIQNCPKGHYAQLSTYLKSFTPYGATYKIIVAKKEEKIVGGIGLIIYGKGPFKLISLPMGPVIATGYEEIFEGLINEGLIYAKEIKAFLFQLQIPYNRQFNRPYLYKNISLPEMASVKKGFPFKVGSVTNQFFMLDLEIEKTHKDWEESMLMTFSMKTRKSVRKVERDALLTIREATHETEIEAAYRLMIQNGIEQGYSTRTWKEFSPTLIAQINNKQAILTTVFKDDLLMGVHYGVIAGESYNYIMGAVRRLEKDYLVGHFMQWNVIKKAKSLGLKTYDFTSMGSPGVYKFKMGFNPQQYLFDTPYYYVLSDKKYNLFYKFFPLVKKYKKNLAKVIGLFVKK